MSSVPVNMDDILEDRDVEAAFYLLSRLLGIPAGTLGNRRDGLVKLEERLHRYRHLSARDKHTIISSYRDIIG